VRVDSALCPDYEVGLHYEPLLAKVIAWGETRQVTLKRLLRALLSFKVEGITCNTPLLRDILASQEFAHSSYHTGSLATWMEARKDRLHSLPENGSMPSNGHDRADREIAAAIAVAMALALKNSQPTGSAAAVTNPWRSYGRREQFLSRTLRKRGWR